MELLKNRENRREILETVGRKEKDEGEDLGWIMARKARKEEGKVKEKESIEDLELREKPGK